MKAVLGMGAGREGSGKLERKYLGYAGAAGAFVGTPTEVCCFVLTETSYLRLGCIDTDDRRRTIAGGSTSKLQECFQCNWPNLLRGGSICSVARLHPDDWKSYGCERRSTCDIQSGRLLIYISLPRWRNHILGKTDHIGHQVCWGRDYMPLLCIDD